MKIKHLFGLAVIAAMTASCSSNEDLGTAGPGTGTNETGVGYATFTINLPSVSGTRAVDAGGAEMNPGTEDEYKVSDATALIFQKYGADEGSYKFVESVNLPVTGAWEDAEEGVTKSKKLVAKLTNVDTKNTYGVLVLLNNNKTGGVKIALPTAGLSYKEWNDKILSPNLNELAKTGEFYMANAPLCKSGKVTTLVTIDKTKIYATEAEAKTKTSADVYVERGVAKMTVADPGTITVKDKATSAATKSEVTFNNWALDITNMKTFAVHNIDGLSKDFPDIWTKERFTGLNSRVYWGKDPNYDNEDLKKNDATGDDLRGKEFNIITATSEIDKDFTTTKTTNPVYCLENTFNLANMYQGQTTRVIFKATYTPKDDTGADLADIGGTFYTIGNMKNILKKADLETAVNKAATSVLSGCTVDYTNLETEGSHVITLADIKDATGTPLVAGTDYSGKTGTEIVKEINDKLGLKAGRPEAMVGINTYLNGVTYYIARVKHFGSLTPWKSGESYGDNNDKYLGRYGMLRNNWYELKVGNVYGPGYPGVPPVDPTQPDDENEKYLSVSVKILSWAKRSDTVDL
ncbi:Mfa1 family fimbria major subunit [Prevotella copri]|uniref:Mfa1 family fimbria major subunit n=1 Tax=Segatella copri TaxID=165179 RepID=A0AAW5I1M1_9BACT|nr:Mfa1 family fimbria major subunit [Segatella copri]MCF0067599.1 Mfa1 family fimbria major subunit [Segatella copri]MCP9501792.1 Mfa1 family fimbria major subunit [Segatella copri]MCP9504509.1 Mfa1 family fimbria major subunit [Segatella copri]MCP9507629.1 Mfa1 family fimbria major subunit [Segatella copri]MCP9510623.1 Mfa1 family fimbria major subunit [Segatella copri]